MNRRHVIGSIGLAALSGVARSAFAQHEHHDTGSGPVNSSRTPSTYPALAAAATDCVARGQACLAHCIRLLSAGDESLGTCADAVSQMIPLCSALQTLATQGSSHTPGLAGVALAACKDCAAACKPHVEHHAECKACYEACLECIRQCEAVA